MRKAIFLIVALQVLSLVAIAMKAIIAPPAPEDMAAAMAVLRSYALILVLALVPAGVLAYTDRWQWAGLAAALFPLVPLAMMLAD